MSTTRDKLTVENTSVRKDKLYVGDPDEAVFLSRSLKARHLRSCDKVQSPKPLELWLLIVVSKGGSWVTFFRSHRVRKMRRPVKDGLVSKLSDLSFPVSSQLPTLFCSCNHDHHSLTVTKWLLLKLWQQRSNDQQSGYFNSNHDLYLIPTTLFLCRDLTKPQL